MVIPRYNLPDDDEPLFAPRAGARTPAIAPTAGTRTISARPTFSATPTSFAPSTGRVMPLPTTPQEGTIAFNQAPQGGPQFKTPYEQKLAQEYARIEAEKKKFKDQQAAKRKELQANLDRDQQLWEEASRAMAEQEIIKRNASQSDAVWVQKVQEAQQRLANARGPEAQALARQVLASVEQQRAQAQTAGWTLAQRNAYEAAKYKYTEAQQRLNTSRPALQQFDASAEQAYNDFAAPLDQRFEKLSGGATAINEYNSARNAADAAYEEARKKYEAAVTQHDKDRAKYEMYLAQKKQYEADSAQRQADIDAGRYAVNPYLFMAQGANLNEIEELRKQMNEGNLRPNMRVPHEFVAPEEVKDPGEFNMAMPEREVVAGPEIDSDVAEFYDYQLPEQEEAAPLPTVSTEKTDTSSVTSNYTSPETTPDKPTEEEKKVKPQQAPPPTTNTLQQTSSQSAQPTQATPQSPPQQQPSVAATNPDTTLPEQESGTVSGQQSQGGQQPQAQPEPEGEAKVFKPGEEEDEEQVFGSG